VLNKQRKGTRDGDPVPCCCCFFRGPKRAAVVEPTGYTVIDQFQEAWMHVFDQYTTQSAAVPWVQGFIR